MTYYRGSMEIMTLSFAHANAQKVLGHLLYTWIMEWSISIMSGGSTTIRNEKADCGLEPDECYWIQHEEQMRHKKNFDPESDPVPDLVLEVETGRSVVRRLAVLAALGIPEVWHYDGETVQVLLLDPEGTYQPAPTSKALPLAPVAEMSRFLKLRHTMNETQVIRQFRDWVREQQAAG